MDFTVELGIFLGVGIILLGLITGFLHYWDFTEDAKTLTGLLDGEKVKDKVDKVGLINEASRFWDFCNHTNASRPRIIYAYNSEEDQFGILTKADMFEQYKELGWCKSIQSANFSCGTREDVNMTDITLPKIIRIVCANSTLFLS